LSTAKSTNAQPILARQLFSFSREAVEYTDNADQVALHILLKHPPPTARSQAAAAERLHQRRHPPVLTTTDKSRGAYLVQAAYLCYIVGQTPFCHPPLQRPAAATDAYPPSPRPILAEHLPLCCTCGTKYSQDSDIQQAK